MIAHGDAQCALSCDPRSEHDVQIHFVEQIHFVLHLREALFGWLRLSFDASPGNLIKLVMLTVFHLGI